MLEKVIICFLLTNVLISVYLKIRQILCLYKKQSESTKKIATLEEFTQMQGYNKDKLIMSIVESVVTNIKDAYFLYYRILQSSYNAYFLGRHKYEEILFFLFFFHGERIFDIPFSLFNTFYIEAKHGFNKTTFFLFLTDFLKYSVITSFLLGFVLHFTLKLVSLYTSSFYLYLWIFLSLFQLSMVIIYPVIIQPLFNKFSELEEGSLKDKIKELALKVGFRASKIFVMDGSKRSGHSNAYFIGITKEKRIVLYDTILTQLTEEEILAVLAHEFGHWYHNHTLNLILKGLLEQLEYLYLINSMLNSPFFEKNLFYGGEPTIIKLIYLSHVFNIFKYPITFISNAVSRRFEREADVFAVSQGYGKELSNALIKIHKENKGNLSPDSLYSAFEYSHPTLVERLELIDSEIKKRN